MEQFEAQDGSVIVRVRLPGDFRADTFRVLEALGGEPSDELVEMTFQGMVDDMMERYRAPANRLRSQAREDAIEEMNVSVRLPPAIMNRVVRSLKNAGETQITPAAVAEEFQAQMDYLGALVAAQDESDRSSLCPECYGEGYCELRELHICVPDR